jgi:hypothetical protein
MTEKGLMVPNEDYVVVPLAVRDRIMARLSIAEATAAQLTAAIKRHRWAILRSPGGGSGPDHDLWMWLSWEDR